MTFEGYYPRGSAGLDEANFISWKIKQFFSYPQLRLNGIVFNLENLDYEWGDDLSVSPPLFEKNGVFETIPYLIVIQESRLESFSYIDHKKRFRFNLRAALAEMNEEISK